MSANDGNIFGIAGGSNRGRNTPVARMPVERFATHYNMKHRNRGLAFILNHEHFDNQTLESRTGTQVDCADLRNALTNLDFEVSVYKDLRYAGIKQLLENIVAMDHTDNDCLLIAIMTHGADGGLIYAHDVKYRLEKVWSQFTATRCPSLAGKPKLFVVQACRGDQMDGGVQLRRGHSETDGDGSMSYTIPLHADFLIAYSTVPGFYSWRNVRSGSWFIQSLCRELYANGKTDDILKLLTFVKQRVAIEYVSYVPDKPSQCGKKEIPSTTTMLMRLLVFGDKLISKETGDNRKRTHTYTDNTYTKSQIEFNDYSV